MRTVRTYGVRAVAAGVLAAALISVVTGLVSTPQAASAAQQEAAFQSRLDEAVPSVKVSSDAAPRVGQASAGKKSATPLAPKAEAATYKPKATSSPAPARPTASVGGLARAQAILATYVARYPILEGATVTFGDAHGYQAICYYKSGRIVISPTHTASLEKILAHEVWHIIDWRDNGQIDWGEKVPPR